MSKYLPTYLLTQTTAHVSTAGTPPDWQLGYRPKLVKQQTTPQLVHRWPRSPCLLARQRLAEWSALTPTCLPQSNACCRSVPSHATILEAWLACLLGHTHTYYQAFLSCTSSQPISSCCRFPQCHLCSGSSAKLDQAPTQSTGLHRIGPSGLFLHTT